MKSNSNNIYQPYLTGLRGLAALMVLLTHAANDGFIPKALGVGYGQIGVIIFFLLSGYLMTSLYIEKGFNYKEVCRFVVARITRVLPLYYLTLVLFIALSSLDAKAFSYFFENISLIRQSFLLYGASNILWTIPVEMRYYLLFTLIWMLMYFFKNKYWLYGFSFLICIPVIILFFTENTVQRSFGLYAIYFNMGGLAFFLMKNQKLTESLSKANFLLVWLVFLVCFLNFPVIRWKLGHYQGPWLDPSTLLFCFSSFLFILSGHKTLKFLSHRYLQLIGNWSFSIYLLHYPILYFFAKYMAINFFTFILFVCTVLIVSYLSYNYYELVVSKKSKNFLLALLNAEN
jgi:peptidoglycan/LPS O-acetylase OafA/YrhL